MIQLQITLSESEGEMLHDLACQTGKGEEELVHEALALLKAKARVAPGAQERLEILRRVRGMWKDRDDLPDFERDQNNL